MAPGDEALLRELFAGLEVVKSQQSEINRRLGLIENKMDAQVSPEDLVDIKAELEERKGWRTWLIQSVGYIVVATLAVAIGAGRSMPSIASRSPTTTIPSIWDFVTSGSSTRTASFPGRDAPRTPIGSCAVAPLAGTSFEMVSPVDGFINELNVVVQKTVTTGHFVEVLVGAAENDVAGLTPSVADGATKGTVISAAATPGHGSRKVSKGDRIQIHPGPNFATAGALNGHIVINTAF